MKNNIFLFLIGTLLMFIVFSGCGIKTAVSKDTYESKLQEIQVLKEEVNNLQKEISEQNFIIKRFDYTEAERDYYRKFIDNILKEMSEDEFIEIAKTECTYSIEIAYGTMENNRGESIAIPTNGIFVLTENSFLLTLTERVSPYPIIHPKDYLQIYNEVRLEDNETPLQILNYKDYRSDGYAASGTIVDSQTYEFIEVPKGSEIRIEISDRLQERLGLNTNIVVLVVSK